MTSLPVHLRGLTRLRLKTKLLLAFTGMAVLCGASGSIGLLFLNRITASVAVFSNVTSPLMEQSTGLVDDAQRMMEAYLAAVTHRRDEGEVLKTIRDMEADSLHRLGVIHRLGHDKLPDDMDEILAAQVKVLAGKLITTLSTMSDRDRATASFDHKLANVYALQLRTDAVLTKWAVEQEGRMAETEDQAKVEVQTGQATIASLGYRFSDSMTEIFPALQNIYKLTRESVRLRDVAKAIQSQADPSRLAEQELQIAGSLKAASSALKKLNGRLRTPGDQSDFGTLSRDVAEIEAQLLRPDGVLAAKRDTLARAAQFAAGRDALDEMEREYYRHINQIDEAIRGMNDKARDEAVRSVTEATSVISVLGIVALIISALVGVKISARLTNPLEQLSTRAAKVQAERGAYRSRDEAMAARSDEFGTLSRALDAMLLELYEARRHLINTSQAELQMQNARLDSALSNMSHGLCMFDAEGCLIISNRRYAELYGHTAGQPAPGTTLKALLNHRISAGFLPEEAQHFVESRVAVLKDGQPWSHVDELEDGRVIAVTAQPMPGGGAVVTHEDVTERRKAEAKIAYLAYHDSLTGLPNRRHFNEGLQAALQRRDSTHSVAVLCLDLDHFKAVNDTLGHPVGDALLQAVAERIRSCLRASDIVARLGGDEFAVIQVGSAQPGGATALAAKLIALISDPYDLKGHYIQAGTTVGIAIAQSADDHPDTLLKNADMALYRAKTDGRGTYRFFEAAMDELMQQRRVLELDLRLAVKAQQFQLFYQPLVDLQSNLVSGFEALIRWNHPRKGTIPPSDFIPMLEELGLIGQVGAWVLKEACAEAAAWPDRIKIAVNLSVVQFKKRAVVLDVAAALMESGLRPSRLELEITESVMLQETTETMATLNELHALGVRISMDDFGTGYSSLSYLRSFPFDKIKIDRSFIRDMSDELDSIAIIRAVTSLSASLGMTTTAEGIETSQQLDQLRIEGCTEGQGYFLGRPKPAGDVAATVRQIESDLAKAAA